MSLGVARKRFRLKQIILIEISINFLELFFFGLLHRFLNQKLVDFLNLLVILCQSFIVIGQ